MLVMVTVSGLPSKMPPPLLLGESPLEMVKPESVTVPATMSKIRKRLAVTLRVTSNRFAPGPLIVRFLSINSSPLVSLIVMPAGREKPMVLPDDASLIAARKVQTPLPGAVSQIPSPGFTSTASSYELTMKFGVGVAVGDGSAPLVIAYQKPPAWAKFPPLMIVPAAGWLMVPSRVK